MEFKLNPLPYASDALEPFIGKDTMEVHHGKHHQAYTTNLNVALENNPNNLSIEEILKNISKYSTAVRNNGGGYFNHNLFWNILKKNEGQVSAKIAEAINKDLGSMDNLKEAFGKAALTRFGSGWAWLIVNASGKLEVCSTPNQDNPLMDIAEVKGTPILGLDVWEHAYYLNYQNRRPDYVNAFWNVVNWEEVEKLYLQAI